MNRFDMKYWVCDVQASIWAFGGKGGKAPAAPDYTPIAEADTEIAQKQYDLAQDQLDWAKDQYNTVWPYAQRYLDEQIPASEEALDYGREDRAFYEDTYRPIEEDFATRAMDYASPARTEQYAGAAMADVADSFAASRKTALSTLESYGIDPSQTRFGALDLASRTQEAAAKAAAGTQSRRSTEAIGLGLEGEAINVGRGYASDVRGSYSTSADVGKSGLAGANETTQTSGYTMGTPGSYFAGGNTSMANASSALNMGYNNTLGGAQLQYDMDKNNSLGLGNVIGGALRLGTAFL